MAEQTGELRRINWDEYFPFTRIFKSFRMAVQPSKLGLALAGVVLMGLLGFILDRIWSLSSNLPAGPEIWAYWQTADIDSWREAQDDARLAELQGVYGRGGPLRTSAPKNLDDLRKPEALGKALKQLKEQYRRAVAPYSPATQPEAIAATADQYAAAYEHLSGYRPRGIFRSFLEYEQEVVGHFLSEARDVLMLDWTSVAGRTDEVLNARSLPGELRLPGDFNEIGMLGSLILMFRGVQWMLTEHFVYALLFLLGSLAIWSLFGGAICRMSALNAARDEQISYKNALSFAGRKFFGFFSAPLLPLLMIALIAFVIWLCSLIFMAIPYVGDVVGPILLGLALLGGFIMAVLAVGAVGGGGLLWPTIGVEGSDGFDAISRSYAYFFQRPWRLAFYAIVAAIYGALTYVVLRYFVYLVLSLTRFFVSLGTWMTERPGTGDLTATKVEAMWPRPTPENLMGDGGAFLGLTRWTESLGSVLIQLWVLLLVLLLCAYLVSFFFSAFTIIYLLLRHRVDATDFEDVYVDEEEQTEVAVSTPTATEGSVETPPPPEIPGPPSSPEPGGA